MNMTFSALGIMGVIGSAMAAGYWIGRGFRGAGWREQNGEEAGEKEEGIVEERRKRGSGRKICIGESVTSPVSGTVNLLSEGGGKGLIIIPDEGNVYAPVSGKITKLYPMGNAFVIRMEDRTEIQVRVGGQPDELCADCFRLRVIQNEIVNKGKLVLVFDRDHLLAAGEDVAVTVSLKDSMAEKEMEVTQASRVKVGDELIKFYGEKS